MENSGRLDGVPGNNFFNHRQHIFVSKAQMEVSWKTLKYFGTIYDTVNISCQVINTGVKISFSEKRILA
jgi:hypothetical protein